MEQMTIGKLADETGVGIETIRYYEKRKLIQPVSRMPSGYRIYDRTSARKIRFIKNAQRLGFTLAETGDLLKLKIDKNSRCDSIKRKAGRKLAEIEEKISALVSMKATLEELIGNCTAELPTDNCPILKSLDCCENNKTGGD